MANPALPGQLPDELKQQATDDPIDSIGKLPIGSIDVSGVPLNEALVALLTPLDLTYEVRDGVLWIKPKP